MTEFTKTELATLAPLQKQIVDAESALAAAQDEYQTKAITVQSARDAFAALGSIPDASAFDTSSSWQAATTEYHFQSTRLQRAVVAVEGPFTEAFASIAPLQEAVEQARGALANATTGTLMTHLRCARQWRAELVTAVMHRPLQTDERRHRPSSHLQNQCPSRSGRSRLIHSA